MFLNRSTYEASLADVTGGLADVTGTDSMSVTPTLSCTPRRSVDGLTTGSTVPRVSWRKMQSTIAGLGGSALSLSFVLSGQWELEQELVALSAPRVVLDTVAVSPSSSWLTSKVTNATPVAKEV
jgi:hypothetical protein